jgi:riboflavin synthase alpha subunit
MFTGLIERQGRIVRPGKKLEVETGWDDLRLGESVAVGGVCLTVARLVQGRAGFDVVPETRRRTTLGALRRGDPVNLERALRTGDRLGGHLVQGHVDGTGRVRRSGALLLIESPLSGGLVPKGSVAVDGVSLTVVEAEDGRFSVALIPVTRRKTTLGRLRVGERVNIELDMLLKRPRKPSRITREFLRRAGFQA